jgi:hypothetical protein
MSNKVENEVLCDYDGCPTELISKEPFTLADGRDIMVEYRHCPQCGYNFYVWLHDDKGELDADSQRP